MKTLVTLCITVATLMMSGCMRTKIAVKHPDGTETTVSRWAFCNTTELPKLEYSRSNGVIRVEGYKNAPDSETLQKAADVAASAAVKAIAGGL